MSVYRFMSRALLPITLVANLIFAGLILADRRHILLPAPEPVLVSVKPSAIRDPQIVEPTLERALSTPAKQSGITWVKLTSKDIRQLVSNLRFIGAPEQVVEYLALAAWDDYAKGSSAIPARPDFWTAGSYTIAASAARDAAKVRLETEGRTLMKELFGYVPDRELKRELANQPEMLFVLGFIPDPKLERVLSELKYLVTSVERFQVPGELRSARMSEVYKQVMAAASIQLSPSEVEEARLRLSIFAISKMAREFSAAGLSGYQSREVLRNLIMKEDPIERLLKLDGPPDQIVDLNNPAIASLITPQQLLKLQRLADPVLNQAFLFAENEGLPLETAYKLHEITRATRAEMESVSDKYLLQDNRRKQSAEIQRITMETLQKIIPPEKMPALQKQFLPQLRGAGR